MAFTAQQREQLKLYMMDYSSDRDAAITGLEDAGEVRVTEALRLMARLNDLENSRLSTVAKAALVSRSGDSTLQAEAAANVLRGEGWRICRALGTIMGLAPLDDYFKHVLLTAPGLFGTEADETLHWTHAL